VRTYCYQKLNKLLKLRDKLVFDLTVLWISLSKWRLLTSSHNIQTFFIFL